MDVLVGGIAVEGEVVRLLVAEDTPAGLAYRGRVRVAGRGAADDVRGLAEGLRREWPAFEVSEAHRRGVVWLEPLVEVEVSYASLSPEGRMRHARLNRIRTDLI